MTCLNSCQGKFRERSRANIIGQRYWQSIKVRTRRTNCQHSEISGTRRGDFNMSHTEEDEENMRLPSTSSNTNTPPNDSAVPTSERRPSQSSTKSTSTYNSSPRRTSTTSTLSIRLSNEGSQDTSATSLSSSSSQGNTIQGPPYGTFHLANGRRGAISGPSSDYFEGKYDRKDGWRDEDRGGRKGGGGPTL